MRNFKTLIPFIAFFIISCQSQSDKVLDDFKKVEESLERSNDSIDSMAQNIKLLGTDQKTSDSVVRIFNEAYAYFKDLKNELKRLDQKGEQLDVAQSLLIQTPKGDSLFNHVMSVYDIGIKYGDSSTKHNFMLVREKDKNKWLEKYFKMVPTIAATTILSKFQNDCNNIRMSVLSAGIVEFKNKILAE
jgi:uncharacterized membrane protein